MKTLFESKTLIILMFVSLIFFSNCESVIVFSEPQPKGVKNLKKIPKKLRGEYLSLDTSSFLIVSEKIAALFIRRDTCVHQNEFGDSIKLDGHIATIIKTGVQFPDLPFEDSLILFEYFVSIIDMDSGTIFRKYKGSYFINNNYESELGWEVTKVVSTKNFIIANEIDSDDITLLHKVTGTEVDTSNHKQLFSPTKKQFKQFLKEGGFTGKPIIFKKYKEE